MTPKQQRLTFLIIVVGCLMGAAFLAMQAFRQHIIFFYTPTEYKTTSLSANRTIRLGGLVKEGTVHYDEAKATITFVITDHTTDIPALYHGVLPDLFREGQGVIAQGNFSQKHDKGNLFVAQTILAKHDEKYMPPEVASALKKKGIWRQEEIKP